MMRSGNGIAVAAIFESETAAHRGTDELERLGSRDFWTAVVRSAHEVVTAAAAPADHHAVAASSDGVLGSIGRFVSGDGSLRRSLVDHGVVAEIAREIDLAIAPGKAVVVVPTNATEAVTAALQAAGGDVYGVADLGSPTERERRAVAGQADDLDRGSGSGRSGGGLGSTTGFLSDRAARHDLGDELVDRVEEGTWDRDRTE